MEPDWDLIRRRRVEDLESCLCHGPYFHRKAERIHGLLEVRSRRISRRVDSSPAGARSRVSICLPQRAYADSPDGDTSLERLYSWPTEAVRTYLMGISGATCSSEIHLRCTGDAPRYRGDRRPSPVGVSGKSVACLLLYRMGRVDFAVDANVLRIMTRLGWLKVCA